MDAAFSERLSREELAPLLVRSDGPGLRRAAIQLVLLLATGAALVLAEGPAMWALLVVHGLVQFTWFGPLHECCHGTAFSSRRLNRAVGAVASFVQLFGQGAMRSFHFAHHRHTHDVRHDPELAGLPMLADWPRGPLALVNASGLPLVLGRTVWTLFSALGLPIGAWSRVMPFVTERARTAVVRDSRLGLLAHGLLLGLCTVEPRLLRLYGAVLVSHGLLAIYVTCEHRGLAQEGDVLARTRSFAGNPVLNWFLWNMPYHAEHHGWPAVPFHALPQLSERVGELPHGWKSVLGLHLRSGA